MIATSPTSSGTTSSTPIAIAMQTSGASGASAAAGIGTRALLVDLTVRGWGARKMDKRATGDVAAQHGNEEHLASVWKRLVEHPTLAKAIRIGEQAREAHRTHTLPWGSGDARVLLKLALFRYEAMMRKYQDEYEAARDEFVAIYPALRNEMQRKLGTLYDAADYPSVGAVRAKFSLTWTLEPLPESGDWRLDLSQAEVDRLRRQYDTLLEQRVQDATRDIADRVRSAVQHVAQRLSDYVPADQGGTGRLHDSMLENVRELADLLPSLNLAADPEIATLAQALRQRVTRFSVQTLKESTAARASVVAAADEIVAKMEDYI